ncbi:MAG: sulfite exporter TauE/SafE family protein [Anaerolineales bacterium]
MPILSYLFALLAATAAGMINALAGGGTLITFPVLMAIGLPAVTANVTNTMALWPGTVGGTLAQIHDLADQKKRLLIVLPAGILGGLTGGLLLLHTTEALFSNLVPFLILLATGLLAIQTPLRNWLARRQEKGAAKSFPEAWIFLPVFLAAIYGGYFGAALGIILLAVLGLLLSDSLTHLNVLKQIISFSANFTAALLFIFSGKVVWSVALVMMVGALLGGSLGGRLAGKVKPNTLRWIVVTIGLIVGIIYLVKTYFVV